MVLTCRKVGGPGNLVCIKFRIKSKLGLNLLKMINYTQYLNFNHSHILYAIVTATCLSLGYSLSALVVVTMATDISSFSNELLQEKA